MFGWANSSVLFANARSVAAFAYSDTAFCADGTIITPALTGSLGGTFSASGGLSINKQTGAIVVEQEGTYNITYNVGLACPASSSVQLTFNSNTAYLSAGIDVAVCAGDTVQLNGVAIGTTFLEWSGNGIFMQSDNDTTSYIPTATDTFELVLTGQSACGVLQQDTVRVIALPNIDFSVYPSDTSIVCRARRIVVSFGCGQYRLGRRPYAHLHALLANRSLPNREYYVCGI